MKIILDNDWEHLAPQAHDLQRMPWAKLAELLRLEFLLRRIGVFARVIRELMRRVESVEEQKNAVYRERNQVVALLARIAHARGWPVWVLTHTETDPEWDPEWRTIVFIDLPRHGQVSWHFHESEQHLITGLPSRRWKWDGHTTEEKYRRVNDAFAGTADRDVV